MKYIYVFINSFFYLYFIKIIIIITIMIYSDLSNNEIKLIDEELKNLENLKYL